MLKKLRKKAKDLLATETKLVPRPENLSLAVRNR
jgi:hypothetical protein